MILASQERQIAHFYKIADVYVSGLKLLGWQVKSIKSKGVSLVGSSVIFDKGAPYIFGTNIYPLKNVSKDAVAKVQNKLPLLLRKSEISRITGQISKAGLILIPLDFHLEHNLIKAKIGLCKKLPKYDLRKRDKEREIDRLTSQEE